MSFGSKNRYLGFFDFSDLAQFTDLVKTNGLVLSIVYANKSEACLMLGSKINIFLYDFAWFGGRARTPPPLFADPFSLVGAC